jgi:hypothetical protein
MGNVDKILVGNSEEKRTGVLGVDGKILLNTILMNSLNIYRSKFRKLV